MSARTKALNVVEPVSHRPRQKWVVMNAPPKDSKTVDKDNVASWSELLNNDSKSTLTTIITIIN